MIALFRELAEILRLVSVEPVNFIAPNFPFKRRERPMVALGLLGRVNSKPHGRSEAFNMNARLVNNVSSCGIFSIVATSNINGRLIPTALDLTLRARIRPTLKDRGPRIFQKRRHSLG